MRIRQTGLQRTMRMRTLFSSRRLLLAVLAPVLAVAVACAPMAPARTTTVPFVDVDRYLGTWYEVGSVKQFFSIGLVNTTAEYSLLPNGWIRVVNRGDFLVPGGPLAAIEGTAVPVDDTNARLNVSFSGSNSAQGPGNYWIVDLDPDYQWAIVSDPTGSSGFLLTRTKFVSPELYQELLDRAAAKGVNAGGITRTQQF
jgi:lipocalin